ncbi:hypothetical protein L1987_15426 [Smallanthus sonchifolius]|uniref:Uncharacterized protein n=1 Tax=Smallanthus sonchifolius TaxID=185202 RepID=A0ACB9J617_9ASTR|nr:hypothetical protein L1987_15426 [Smallanthus sonchifolius]
MVDVGGRILVVTTVKLTRVVNGGHDVGRDLPRLGGGLRGREVGGELWGEDFGVKSKLGGNDWDVESEKAKDEGVLTFREKDEKEDLSVGGFSGRPCERVWGIH